MFMIYDNACYLRNTCHKRRLVCTIILAMECYLNFTNLIKDTSARST